MGTEGVGTQAEPSVGQSAVRAQDPTHDPVRDDTLRRVHALTEFYSVRRIGVAVIVILVAARLTFWFFLATRHFLFLLLLAWLAAIAMEPAVGWLVRRNMRRGFATGLVMFTLFVLVTGFFAIFGNLLIDQISNLVQALPGALTSLVEWVNRTFHTSIDPTQLNDTFHLAPSDVTDWAQKFGLGLFGFFTSLVGIVFDFFLVLLFAFYFSADGPRVRRFLASWLPQESQRVVNNVWEVAVQKTGGYVASRIILAVLSAAFTSVFLLLLDVPYWLPLGIWTGVVSQFIPTLGTYLGGALPALFAFAQSTPKGVAVIVFVIVYQQIENYFFLPRISQKTMNIHPAVAFGSVVVGGAVGGAMGALIAIPIVASIQSLIETYGRRYELIPELAPPDDHPLGHKSEVPRTGTSAESSSYDSAVDGTDEV
jgi:predicted PurR-regulated permease PerM